MKQLSVALAVVAVSLPMAAWPAGDPVAGKQKAAECIACHGSETFPGMFFNLQLAGRNADKLLIKSLKYKNGKILHPIMNMATAFYSEKDLEDISAYYQSLGKPAFSAPYFHIKGDDEPDSGTAPTPAAGGK